MHTYCTMRRQGDERLSPLCRAWTIESLLATTAADDVHRRDIEEGGREGGVCVIIASHIPPHTYPMRWSNSLHSFISIIQ